MNKCTFGFHNWNMWKIEAGTITTSTFGVVTDERETLVQGRTCKRCGKYQDELPSPIKANGFLLQPSL